MVPKRSFLATEICLESIQCEAPKIAKLVPITPMSLYGLCYANNELVTGANLNQLITGGPHIVGKCVFLEIYTLTVCY